MSNNDKRGNIRENVKKICLDDPELFTRALFNLNTLENGEKLEPLQQTVYKAFLFNYFNSSDDVKKFMEENNYDYDNYPSNLLVNNVDITNLARVTSEPMILKLISIIDKLNEDKTCMNLTNKLINFFAKYKKLSYDYPELNKGLKQPTFNNLVKKNAVGVVLPDKETPKISSNDLLGGINESYKALDIVKLDASAWTCNLFGNRKLKDLVDTDQDSVAIKIIYAKIMGKIAPTFNDQTLVDMDDIVRDMSSTTSSDYKCKLLYALVQIMHARGKGYGLKCYNMVNDLFSTNPDGTYKDPPEKREKRALSRTYLAHEYGLDGIQLKRKFEDKYNKITIMLNDANNPKIDFYGRFMANDPSYHRCIYKGNPCANRVEALITFYNLVITEYKNCLAEINKAETYVDTYLKSNRPTEFIETSGYKTESSYLPWRWQWSEIPNSDI